MERFILIILCLFIPDSRSETDAIRRALAETGIKSSDPIQVKVNLILNLLNNRKYLFESSPNPMYQKHATFHSTPKAKANALLKKYQGQLDSGDPFSPYDLESLRSPSEMLEQRIGGACETHARSFAALLQASGVPIENIRIIDAVTVDDYRLLCPNGQNSKMNKNYLAVSGHAFVMVKTEHGRWKIINSTFSPIHNSNVVEGTHQDALMDIRNRKIKPPPDQYFRIFRLSCG